MFKKKTENPEDLALIIAELEKRLETLKGQKTQFLAADAEPAEIDRLTRELETCEAKITVFTKNLSDRIDAEVVAEVQAAGGKLRDLNNEISGTLRTAGEHLGKCLALVSKIPTMAATAGKLRSALGEYSDAPQSFREGQVQGLNETAPAARDFQGEKTMLFQLDMANRDGNLLASYKSERFRLAMAGARKAATR